MTTAVESDNRSILDECDSTSGWTATDGPTLFTADPAPIEATGYLGMQVSNNDEDAYTTITSDDYSQGGTLSIWMQERASLDTTANVGFGMVLGDGTDRIAFSKGSDTVTAFRHETGPVKWACFLLDPANLPSDTFVLAGSLLNLTLTAITQVGVYFNTTVKSVGGTENCFWDIIRWANPGDDVAFYGGTSSMTAGNGAEAAVVDRSTANQQGYGVIRELAVGVYGIQGNITIGHATLPAGQFWEETNVTYAWEARELSDRNYYRFNFVGSSGQTSSNIFNTSTFTVPSGADARLDANGANLDVVTFNACTFIGWNVGIVTSDDTGDDWTNCTYIDCGPVIAEGCDLSGSRFSGAINSALIESQDETSYDDTTTEGGFTAGTGYAASDTITLSNGQLITVDAVSMGAVTQFTVTTSEGFPAYAGYTLTQASTSGSGTGFELWPRTANLDEGGALYYDLAVDPDGELDDCTFTQGNNTNHAIVFGPNIPSSITLRDITFSGYTAMDNQANSALHFLDTTGTITVNIVGGTTPSYKSEGATIDIVNSVTVTINGVAEGTPVKVIADETVGTITSGDVLFEGLADSTGEVSFTLSYESAFEPSGLDVLIRARNQGLPNAAIADDGGVQTDETTEANSPTTDDMTLTPAVPVVNDAYYFGHNEEFSRMKVDVSTVGANQTITWEYWNGSWTALSGVTDDTSSFTASGENTISWTLPNDWADTTVNSQGPYRYVRARVSAIGMSPTGASGRQSSLDVTRYLPIPQEGVLQRTITSSGLTATLSQAVDTISRPFG